MDTLLQAMLEQLERLKETLTQEEAVLSARNMNAALLHRTTEKKNEQLTALDYLDSQRKQRDLALQLTAPYDTQPALHALWLSIQSLTRQLNHHNQRNGILLRQHMKYTDEALSYLKNKSNLYGPNGQSII